MHRILCFCILLIFALPAFGAEDAVQERSMATKLGPGEHSLILKVGTLNRHYIVHVPPSYDGTKPMPVVIMLHGGGGTSRTEMIVTGWAQKADKESFIAVFPDAMPPDPKKNGHFRKNPQTWNDGSGRFDSGEQDIPDVAFIDAMIDDLIARFSVDRRRIYVTGFSNGASMAFRVGVELSSRIAAIAPVAGTLWIKQPTLDRPVPLYYIVGSNDTLCPINGGVAKFATGRVLRNIESTPKPSTHEFIDTWVRLLDCQSEPKSEHPSPGITTLIYGGGRGDSEVQFTVIEGHGHIWPGGKNLLPEWMVGKASSDQFKATDVVWEFFKKHELQEIE